MCHLWEGTQCIVHCFRIVEGFGDIRLKDDDIRVFLYEAPIVFPANCLRIVESVFRTEVIAGDVALTFHVVSSRVASQVVR
jgi:hypothetical protein